MNGLGDTRSPRLDSLLVGAAALTAYLVTLAPTVTTGDSGELITAAATLGVPHPTGFPLYLLLGRAFITLFFFLSPAAAMNLFSAVCAAAAALLLQRAGVVLLRSRAAAAATALTFAFSASLWSEATTARTYALNAALVAAVLLELARLHRGSGGSLRRGWALLGLALANHLVAVVLLPPLVALTWRRAGSAKSALRTACWCLPGLSLYLYLPIAAWFDPYQNWGNPSTPGNLVRYLVREGYWQRRFVTSAGDLVAVVLHYLRRVPAELTWPGACLLAAGLVAGRRRDRAVTALGLYLFLANLALVALHGSLADIFHWPRYLIPGWLGLTVLLGQGLDALLTRLRWKPAALLSAWAAPALAFALHLPTADRSGIRLAEEYNRRILERVEPGALLFAEGDNVLFPLVYLHHVEGTRPDVTLVLQGVNKLSSMPVDPDRTPVYFTHHHPLGRPELQLVPDGLVYRLVRTGTPFSGRAWSRWSTRSFEEVTGPGHLEYLDRNLVGDYLLMKAVNLEGRDPEAARTAVTRAMAVDYDNPRTFVNAGLLLERNLRFGAALAAFEQASRLDPRDPLAAGRVAFWRQTLARIRPFAPLEERARRLATALLENRRGDLALQVLEDAAARCPQSFALRHDLAALRIVAGDLEGAEHELEQALALEPDSPTARHDLEEVRARLRGRRPAT